MSWFIGENPAYAYPFRDMLWIYAKRTLGLGAILLLNLILLGVILLINSLPTIVLVVGFLAVILAFSTNSLRQLREKLVTGVFKKDAQPKISKRLLVPHEDTSAGVATAGTPQEYHINEYGVISIPKVDEHDIANTLNTISQLLNNIDSRVAQLESVNEYLSNIQNNQGQINGAIKELKEEISKLGWLQLAHLDVQPHDKQDDQPQDEKILEAKEAIERLARLIALPDTRKIETTLADLSVQQLVSDIEQLPLDKESTQQLISEVDQWLLEQEEFSLDPAKVQGERQPPVASETIKERKKATLARYAQYIPIFIFMSLHQRGYRPTRREFDALVIEAAKLIVRRVNVSGKDWHPDKSMKQVDQLLHTYISDLRLPSTSNKPTDESSNLDVAK